MAFDVAITELHFVTLLFSVPVESILPQLLYLNMTHLDTDSFAQPYRL